MVFKLIIFVISIVDFLFLARNKDEGDSVRVMNQHTSNRVLIKGLKKRVVDIAFESFKSNRLACVDSAGNLHMYEISEGSSAVKYLFNNIKP